MAKPLPVHIQCKLSHNLPLARVGSEYVLCQSRGLYRARCYNYYLQDDSLQHPVATSAPGASSYEPSTSARKDILHTLPWLHTQSSATQSSQTLAL